MNTRPGWVAARTVNLVRKQAEAERLERLINSRWWNRTTYWELRQQLDLKHETLAIWRNELEES